MKAVVAVVAVLVLAAPARAQDRLDRAAEGATPLYVHPELGYLLSDADRAQIRTALGDAHLPFDVRIVALPSLEADESGGQADRALWAIDDRLPKAPRLLISVDQRGDLDFVAARLNREIEVPFDVQYRRDGKEIVPRLRTILQLAAKAKDGSAYYQRERPSDPLDPLPEDTPDREDASDSPGWPRLIGPALGGLFAGVLGWGLSVAIRRGRRA